MVNKLILAALLVLAACAAPPLETAKQPVIGYEGRPLITAQGDIDTDVLKELTAHPAACEAAGGSVRPVCLRGNPMCMVKFRDGGKACSSSSDCSGRCLGDNSTPMGQKTTGKCALTNDPCGCFQLIENGVAQPTLCAD